MEKKYRNLIDFYKKTTRRLYIDENKVEDIEENVESDGFVSLETCVLKQSEMILALYVEQKKIYFYCDGKIVEIDSDFSVKRTVLPIFVHIVIRHPKNRFYLQCYQRWRDIDPFLMNDFFYNLKFISDRNFDGFIDVWPNSVFNE